MALMELAIHSHKKFADLGRNTFQLSEPELKEFVKKKKKETSITDAMEVARVKKILHSNIASTTRTSDQGKK